jgi:flagellar hook-associated protein 3 FlgL
MLVRTTFNSRLRYMARSNVRTAAQLSKLHEKITTGKRINRLSDEPWSSSELHQLRRGIKQQRYYKDAATRGLAMLGTIDTALSSALTLVDRAKSLAVQLSNDSYNAVEREGAAVEVEMMKDRLKEIANTDFHGRYIFGGMNYVSVPFDNTYAYSGGTSDALMYVSEVSTVEVGFNGDAVFNGNGALAGNVNIFTALDDLETALVANDVDSVRDAIDDFDDAFSQIDVYRTKTGMSQRISMDMQELSESFEIDLQARLSSVEDANIAESLTMFSLMQTQYEVNLQLTSKMKTMSLFSRI